MPNANELAREIVKSYLDYELREDDERFDSLFDESFTKWASTPEALTLIAQLSGVGGMKWVKASELPEKLPDIIVTNIEGKVFAYNIKHSIKGFNEVIRHRPDVLCFGFSIDPEYPTPSGEQDGGEISQKEVNTIAIAFIDACNIWRKENDKERIPASAFLEIGQKAAESYLTLKHF